MLVIVFYLYKHFYEKIKIPVLNQDFKLLYMLPAK